jgi:hypothetical protein
MFEQLAVLLRKLERHDMHVQDVSPASIFSWLISQTLNFRQSREHPVYASAQAAIKQKYVRS